VSCDVVCGPTSLRSGHAARKEVVLSYKSTITEEKKGRGIKELFVENKKKVQSFKKRNVRGANMLNLRAAAGCESPHHFWGSIS
jgi:hypothetical protein